MGRILRQAESYHLKTPDFIEMDTAFRVNLYRTEKAKSSEKIIKAIQKNPAVTIEELAKITRMTTRFVEKNLKKTERSGAHHSHRRRQRRKMGSEISFIRSSFPKNRVSAGWR